MATRGSKLGRVVTFYSFKGGVGRTMALANVALISALNRLSVLMIDWDLEAPGLVYYFRGLVDASDFKELSDNSPGLLNMFVGWEEQVISGACPDLDETDVANKFFEQYVRTIPIDGQGGRSLAYCSPGTRVIGTRQYSEILGSLSLRDFFTESAGGYLLERFIAWARRNFDLVLIDSRTGLADSAGICTIQVPDVVYLCFCLNRQNIDGTARVAEYIRAKKQDRIRLEPVPMRLGRTEQSSDELNVISYAVSSFVRANLLGSRLKSDQFRALGTPLLEEIQFHEPLLALMSTGKGSTNADRLHCAYVELARRAMPIHARKRIGQVTIPDDVKALANKRLAPKRVTLEYVETVLAEAEPNRRAEELCELIDKLSIDREFEDDAEYLLAVVKVLGKLIDESFQVDDDSLLYISHQRCIELLRSFEGAHPGKWRSVLIEELLRHINAFDYLYLEDTEVLSIFEEIDQRLESASPKTSFDRDRQILACRRALVYALGSDTPKMPAANLAERLETLQEQYIALYYHPEESEHARLRRADTGLLKARVKFQEGRYADACSLLEKTLHSLTPASPAGAHSQAQRIDEQRLKYECLALLVESLYRLGEARRAFERLVESVDLMPEGVIGRVIIRESSRVRGADALEFLRRIADRLKVIGSQRIRPGLSAVAVGSKSEYSKLLHATNRLFDSAFSKSKMIDPSLRTLIAWLQPESSPSPLSISEVRQANSRVAELVEKELVKLRSRSIQIDPGLTSDS